MVKWLRDSCESAIPRKLRLKKDRDDFLSRTHMQSPVEVPFSPCKKISFSQTSIENSLRD